ncbi:hypothetical protein Tco_0385290 [Tanacetum coccineum]
MRYTRHKRMINGESGSKMVSSFSQERRYGGATGYVRKGRKIPLQYMRREVQFKSMKSDPGQGWEAGMGGYKQLGTMNSWFLVGKISSTSLP